MSMKSLFTISIALLTTATACNTTADKSETKTVSDSTAQKASAQDPLPSWNDGATKKAIVDYVTKVTKDGSPDFIPVPDRIATFDNDGTLWSEQPLYVQLYFAIDQVKALAANHPEWKNKHPFKAAIENDIPGLMKQGNSGLMQIAAASHANTTTDAFDAAVKAWIDTAKNPVKKQLFKKLVYQPMIELIDYLEANKFKVFIVSGGGIEFMRAWAEDEYGIPKDQIIGSTGEAKYDYKNGKPTIEKLPELDFNNDKEGKPVAIQRFIGRKPVFAGGNSDGDLQMLQWTASNKYKTFELYVHHTDSAREWAYDRNSHIGTFNKGWDEAVKNGWTVTSMKDDWKVIYPFEMKK